MEKKIIQVAESCQKVMIYLIENEYFISLQTFDRDKNSQNYHVLMDRIGICKYNKFINKPDYFNLMKLTSLELPLNDRDLEDLYELLIDDDKLSEL